MIVDTLHLEDLCFGRLLKESRRIKESRRKKEENCPERRSGAQQPFGGCYASKPFLAYQEISPGTPGSSLDFKGGDGCSRRFSPTTPSSSNHGIDNFADFPFGTVTPFLAQIHSFSDPTSSLSINTPFYFYFSLLLTQNLQRPLASFFIPLDCLQTQRFSIKFTFSVNLGVPRGFVYDLLVTNR